jgi:septal ring factor EnvC (AmiA/AmiB activator)
LKRLTHDICFTMPNPKGHQDSIKDSRFKAAWQSGATRTIRVPIALAKVTLEYARQLDRGVEPRDTMQVSNDEISIDSCEPRDTHKKTSRQIDDLINVLPVEPHDTCKMQVELEDTRANYAKLLELSTQVTNKLRQELAEVRSQLATERADREEVETELSDLKQNSAPAVAEFLEAADILNQLKARRKKSKADLADVEAILELLE